MTGGFTCNPILIDTAAAAVYLEVTPAAIRQLATRGTLTRYGTTRRRLYDVRELARHAATTRGPGHPSGSSVTLERRQDPYAPRG